jgi:hypothetical protein
MTSVSVYWQTWSGAWGSDPEKLDLYAGLADGIQVVNLAFADPNMVYTTGMFAGTGLQFSSDFSVVKASIALLRKKGVKVMLSVGGGSYPFAQGYYNAKSCCILARDLGCDGIDIDWEPAAGNGDDALWGPIIVQFKSALWQGGLLSAAVWSVGAAPKDVGSLYAGMNIKGLQSSGMNLDWINIMAYDAGTSYKVAEAFGQYRSIFKGPIMIGLEVGQQAWGGKLLSNADVQECIDICTKDGLAGNGIFVWAYQKECGGTPTVEYIISQAHAQKVPEKEWKVMLTCPACKYNVKLDYF